MTIEEVAKPIADAPLEVQWALLVAEGFTEEEVEVYLESTVAS
jgi:hypothetical protein